MSQTWYMTDKLDYQELQQKHPQGFSWQVCFDRSVWSLNYEIRPNPTPSTVEPSFSAIKLDKVNPFYAPEKPQKKNGTS